MSLPVNDRKTAITATSGQTLFTPDFPLFAVDEVRVEQTTTADPPITTTVDPADYTINYTTPGVFPTTFTITMDTGVTLDYVITIYGARPLRSVSAFTTGGDFTADNVNRRIDEAAAERQEMQRDLDALEETVDNIVSIEGDLTPGYIPYAADATSLTDSVLRQENGEIFSEGPLDIETGMRFGSTLLSLSSSRITVTDETLGGVIGIGGPTANLDEIIGGSLRQILLLTISSGELTIRHNIAPTGGGQPIVTRDGLDYVINATEQALLNRGTSGWALITPARDAAGNFTTLDVSGDTNINTITATGAATFEGDVTVEGLVEAAGGAALSGFGVAALTSSRITITENVTGVVVTGGTGNLDEIIGGVDAQFLFITPNSGVLTIRYNIAPTGGGRRIYTYDGADYQLEENETAFLVRGAAGWNLISPTATSAGGSVPAASIAPGTEGQVLATVAGVADWATILGLNGQDGSAAAPTFAWASQALLGAGNGAGHYLAGLNIPAVSSADVERQRWADTETVINEGGSDYNTRIETEDEPNAVVVEGTGTGSVTVNVPFVATDAVTLDGGAVNVNASNANVNVSLGSAGTDTAFLLDADGATAGGGQAEFNVPLNVRSAFLMNAGANVALTSSQITVTDQIVGAQVTGGTGNLDEIIGGVAGQWLFVTMETGTLTIRNGIAPTGGGNGINTYDDLNYEIVAGEIAVLFKTATGAWILMAPTLSANGSFANLTATGTINFAGATVSNLGTVTTADINGGTVDGTNVGATTRGTGAFTTLSANAGLTIDGATVLNDAGASTGDLTWESDTVATALVADANGSDEAEGLISTAVPFAALAGFAFGGNGGDASKAVSSSRLTVEDNVAEVVATGGSVNLDEIVGGKNRQLLVILPFTGTNLTIRHNIAPTGGGLGILTYGGNNYVVSPNEAAMLWRTSGGWILLSPTTGTT